jgi:hypothetical protein
VINPVSLPFFYSIRMFLSSLTLCNTSSFFTRSFQIIFSIFLRHCNSKLSRNCGYTFQSVKLSVFSRALFEMLLLNTSFFKLNSNFLVKRIFYLLNAAFPMAILGLISRLDVTSFAVMVLIYLKVLQLFLIYHNLYRECLPRSFHSFFFIFISIP